MTESRSVLKSSFISAEQSSPGKVEKFVTDNFRPKDSMNIFMATNKIHMKYNGRVYVGNAFGYEFTTPGPESYNVKEGR